VCELNKPQTPKGRRLAMIMEIHFLSREIYNKTKESTGIVNGVTYNIEDLYNHLISKGKSKSEIRRFVLMWVKMNAKWILDVYLTGDYEFFEKIIGDHTYTYRRVLGFDW